LAGLILGDFDRARPLQLRPVLFGPFADGLERLRERPTERCQRVFHLGRNDWIYPALDKTVPFQPAEGLGQHLLGYPADFSLELTVPLRTARQGVDDESRPAVGDQAQNPLRAAPRIEHIGLLPHTHHLVCISLMGAYLQESP